LFTNLFRALKISLLSFVISLTISFLSGSSLGFWLSATVLLVVILTGIIFDIVGTAVTAATESPFHAMAADKVKGSKQAIYLIRSADRVANICNDVVGDIAGTLSGALIVGIVFNFKDVFQELGEDLLSSIAVALIAALTVGGKAAGKTYAIDNANQIIFTVGKGLSLFKIDFHTMMAKQKKKGNSRKAKRNK
jgi:CBS domain containing-hemolysin-like protein